MLVYDRFHVMQHANKAVDEVRRAEFFRQGSWRREVLKGKRWLLTRWVNVSDQKQQQLNQLFALNRRLMKADLLQESLERLCQQPAENVERVAALLDPTVAMAAIEVVRKPRLSVAGSC